MTDLLESTKKIQNFEGGNLKVRLARLETEFEGINKNKLQLLCSENRIDDALLDSAITLKKAMGQVNVVIHAIGVILLLPKILRSGEVIESLSLGAGSTGKKFDLDSNLRIAEFKFIHWKGGSESMWQNALFKDFFYLAEEDTNKKRYLYIIGLEHPLKFLNGSRAITSVLSRNAKLSNDFQNKYRTRFRIVSEYYNYRKHLVEIIDINQVMPSLASSLP